MQFLVQLLVLFFFFFVLTGTIFALIGYFFEQTETFDDLTKASDSYIESRVEIKGETASYEHDLKVLVEEQDGWLAVLTENGKIINSFQAPENLEAGDLQTFLSQEQFDITTYWKLQELTDSTYYVVFGTHDWQANSLEAIQKNVNWENQKLELSLSEKEDLNNYEGWTILVDRSGTVLDSFGKEAPSAYDTEDLLATNSSQHRTNTTSYFHQASQLRLIVGKAPVPSSLATNVQGSINNSVIVITILVILFLLFATLWYAHKFSSPLVTFMNWLRNLRQGIYEQPVNPKTGQPVLLNKHGKLKRNYHLYQDLIFTLKQLTTILKESEFERKRTSQSREEWISGISHDLKTPLASIQGYANMMESDTYSWSEEEIRSFATIIGEKSTYLKDLIHDLNLTYQLKNQELSMVKELADINECIRRSFLHFFNNSIYNDKELRFQPTETELITSFDPKWFQRVMDNLIANALKYNPPNTIITVSTELIEQHLIVIKVTDNGVGMDKDTLQHLFTRYYRGTNTTDLDSGTGLGLAISKQLIDLHNGSISVQSEPGEGTTIRMLLPVDRKESKDKL
ncbi:Signal transduction histidine kinase [Gracilibacillus kekensis]|uniref:histidine kinase n=2 Tax=Gracilibacillus kekensis TaxID=1027249 RepID=A0A1M7LH04_9BACI|nr:Signal transduction histidine kinase [Gracilibacillus kekensis]